MTDIRALAQRIAVGDTITPDHFVELAKALLIALDALGVIANCEMCSCNVLAGKALEEIRGMGNG